MIAVEVPDVERLVVDWLDTQLSESVGITVPANWKPGTSPPFLQVACDGHPSNTWPVTMNATVRLVAWASTKTAAKALAAKAQGVLCSHPGGGGISSARPLTGPLPARDASTGAELAAVTCRVILRTKPLA